MVTVTSRLDGVAADSPAVVAAGFFDGFHLGHRAVAAQALADARRRGCAAWALTFARHPLAVLEPEAAPPLLSTPSRRLRFFEDAGFAGACIVDFDRELAAIAPGDFAGRLKTAFPRIAALHCGGNWRFGRGGAGTPGSLAASAAGLGFEVAVAPDVLSGATPVSSTRIRAALAAGDIGSANEMLGRPFSVEGEVVHGRRVGSANGFPTANIATGGLALPKNGVYEAAVLTGAGRFKGIADIGLRPTFGDARPASPALEVHLLDFDGDLYGTTVEVEFARRLRDEIRFPTKEALFAQIRRDIEEVRG